MSYKYEIMQVKGDKESLDKLSEYLKGLCKINFYKSDNGNFALLISDTIDKVPEGSYIYRGYNGFKILNDSDFEDPNFIKENFKIMN